MIASTTPGAAEAWRMAALRLADLVLLDQPDAAKYVAQEIVSGEPVTVTLTRDDGTRVDAHSLDPRTFVHVKVKEST